MHAPPEHLLQHRPRADADLPDDATPLTNNNLLDRHAVHHERLLDAVAPVVEVCPAVVHRHDGVRQLLVQPTVHGLADNLDGLRHFTLIRRSARR